MIRVSLIDVMLRCPLLIAKNGNQYIRYPSMNIKTVRFSILSKNVPLPISLHLFIEKLIAFPTANKNDGNTRSVGVNPCQLACNRGAKGVAPLPGVFTMIMKQTVIPRNTSSERKRNGDLFIFIFFK